MTTAKAKKGAEAPPPPAYIIHDVVQDTDEWRELKLGVPTTSHFATVLASGRAGEPSKTRDLYIRKLAGELVSRKPREDYFTSFEMKRGAAMEPTIRSLYTLETGRIVRPVTTDPDAIYQREDPPRGFATRRLKSGVVVGSSPDGFVASGRGVEFKSAAPHVLMEIFAAGHFPSEHVAQCQGHMLVHGWDACDIAIGYEGCPLFVRTLKRDTAYIARLEVALEQFAAEVDAKAEWFRRQR